MDPRDTEFIQKIFLAHLHFPDTDDSDSDFDPDEYESSDSDTDDDFQDSEEEPEDDLSHIDPKNILGQVGDARAATDEGAGAVRGHGVGLQGREDYRCSH